MLKIVITRPSHHESVSMTSTGVRRTEANKNRPIKVQNWMHTTQHWVLKQNKTTKKNTGYLIFQWSAHLATGLVYCSTSTCLGQQWHFSTTQTNISQKALHGVLSSYTQLR